MDAVYQAVKNLFKAVLGLLAAGIELLAGLIGWLANILVLLRPRIGERKTKETKTQDEGVKDSGQRNRKENRQDVLIEQIRNELKEKVTDKESYYYVYSQAEEAGTGFYLMLGAVLFCVLAATVMLYGISASWGLRAAAVIMLTAICGGACLAVLKHRRKMIGCRLAKLILEEEFKEKREEGFWLKEEKPEVSSKAEEEERAKESSRENGSKILSISEVGKEEIG